ncbi:DUF1330 domain-containing protein [Georgenia sp. SYP-B2076]|uniref:DUF1330 domain-containing protein n=1 Tax=Georgenia sp. SYP-B2076 TaxID=2495881 RepID=UPI000F8C8DDE|nr:DUF1330 domain-containing protein [Georgenia sp. SYP-B2076]
MTTYVIARIREIMDPDRFDEYRTGMPAALAQYGGRYLVRGALEDVAEGGEPERIAVIEFPSREAADTFWNSEEYTALRNLREGATIVQIGIVDGVMPQP